MKPEDEQEVEEGGESGVTVSERVLILFLCYSKGVVKARPIRGPGGGVKAPARKGKIKKVRDEHLLPGEGRGALVPPTRRLLPDYSFCDGV